MLAAQAVAASVCSGSSGRNARPRRTFSHHFGDIDTVPLLGCRAVPAAFITAHGGHFKYVVEVRAIGGLEPEQRPDFLRPRVLIDLHPHRQVLRAEVAAGKFYELEDLPVVAGGAKAASVADIVVQTHDVRQLLVIPPALAHDTAHAHEEIEVGFAPLRRISIHKLPDEPETTDRRLRRHGLGRKLLRFY